MSKWKTYFQRKSWGQAAAEIGGDVENPALLLRLRELVADASTTVAAAAEETLRSSEQNLVSDTGRVVPC